MSFSLPTALEPFREQISRTALPYSRITPLPARATELWESKVGGHPYLPLGAPLPEGPDGRTLFFLAQINFADMPPLAGFPEKGLLSFFINDDDLYGMNFDEETKGDFFRVLFFPEVLTDPARLRRDFPVDRPFEELPHHPGQSFPLRFEAAEEVAPVTDYRFWQTFGPDFFQQFGADEWAVLEEYHKTVSAQGHKVGGYAYFTQDDPRKADDPMLLLFQLDSDQPMDLMWGDTGVGHFFIREKDLKQGDFSRVWFDWDGM
ncbi:MAG: DUF1963 domain-containing protein [Saprospiraceae bacterium]|nr:DUF1963 domain-containing protein [Saprospiraceae bacterium]